MPTPDTTREEERPPEVLYEMLGHVALITLNRPHRRNAITTPMLRLLSSRLDQAAVDPEVRVVVLTGAGDGFCAGLDLKSLDKENRSGGDASKSMQKAVSGIGRAELPPVVLHELAKPTIAAVRGAAAGYGFDLALGCDVRVVGRSSRLMGNFVTRGVVPESGGTWLLPRLVGQARAAELVFRGATVTGDEAVALGLANQVVPDDEVVPAALALAEEIAANAPLAVQAAKRLLQAADQDGFEAHVHRVLDVTRELFGTADFREGIASFAERRPPVFTGR
ncbi:MAG TPA: enoyl-CoA hydratase-related protein [Acidimicrobiales bacterium]|nr:enoyl-CoA hydratase-related protein [Acidimicrobiales bacterium]